MWALRTAAVCEGLTQDARGFLALVGFEAPAFVAPEFPAQVLPCAVVIYEQDDDDLAVPAGTMLSFRTTIVAPDGVVVFLNEGRQPAPARSRNPHLPDRVQHVAQMPFVAQKAGWHTVKMLVTIGESDNADVLPEAQVRFLVLDADSMRASES